MAVDKKKVWIGVILIILTASAVFYEFNKIKIKIDKDKTTWYQPHIEYPWIWTVVGRERVQIFEGRSLKQRDVDNIEVITNINTEQNHSATVRTTPYKVGPVVKETYYFEGDIKSVEKFPIWRKVEVYNATGMFLRYDAFDMVTTGERYALDGKETIVGFGRNMKIDLEEGYRWAWVYKNGGLHAQYDIDSDYEVFYIRMYDPPAYKNKVVTECVDNRIREKEVIDRHKKETYECVVNNQTEEIGQCERQVPVYKTKVITECVKAVRNAYFGSKKISLDNTELEFCDEEKCCSELDLDSCCYLENSSCEQHRAKQLRKIVK